MQSMRGNLLRRGHLLASHLRLPSPPIRPSSSVTSSSSCAAAPLLTPALRPFCSSSDSQATPPESKSGERTASLFEALKANPPIEDVSNEELKRRLDVYYKDDCEEALASVWEAIMARRMSGKHEHTDDELIEELRMKPLDDVKDQEFESDFEEMHETDEEIEDLYNARQYVENKMMKDEFFNMNDEKWDNMIREATEKGFLKDTKECEDILEDMLSWDKLLPGKNKLMFMPL